MEKIPVDVHPIAEYEKEPFADKLLTEITFDAKVVAYEQGVYKGRPQWFKMKINLSLDAIKNFREEDIGRVIKEAFERFDNHISKYENLGEV